MKDAVSEVYKSNFHVRFDNAYYSVDKAFLHKKVSIKASSTVVRIYSLTGEFLCEWPRATRKGQWSTNPDHLPDNYKGFTSGMLLTLSRKPSSLARIQRLLFVRFSNPDHMKYRPIVCAWVF